MTESTETPAAAAAPEKTTPTENGSTETPQEEAPEKATEEKETPPPKEMRAVVLTGFGGLKTVKILKKPEPTVGEGEVLIRVKAWYVFIFYINLIHLYPRFINFPLHYALIITEITRYVVK